MQWLDQGHSVDHICDMMNMCRPSCNVPPRGCECGDRNNFCEQECPLPSTTSCVRNCSAAGEPVDLSICDWYIAPEQLTWLPTAYAHSAHCACKLETVSGRLSNTAMCVRKFLIAVHQNMSPDLKATMKSWKSQYCNDFMCDPQYLIQIETQFVPIAYKVHVQAYNNCCCPNNPAPYPYWMALMFNYKGITPCAAIAGMIEAKGPCGCDYW